ncbi:DUF7079 family protein [Ampullimonas aquatilis]|uniref:DUF7079 family protein n=1 Tax=Ampullimonas aquatilis TaxID=1341549 RepID=UPI003C7956AC
MLPARSDLQNRRPVWEVLSELFLHLDDALGRSWRIDILARSPYSVTELEHILIDEVYPACRSQPLYFDEDGLYIDHGWLEEIILSKLASSWRFLGYLDMARFIAQWSVLKSEEWQATRQGIELTRLQLSNNSGLV